jgi:hypothetical protein
VQVQLHTRLSSALDKVIHTLQPLHPCLPMHRKLGGSHSRSECSAEKKRVDISIRSTAFSLYFEVVVCCCFDNVDRGFIIYYLKFNKFQLTMASRQNDSANRAVVYSITCMH